MQAWPIIQGLLLAVIALVGAIIAYGQYRNAAVKLQLDLYDRRYKIYEAAKAIVFAMSTQAAISEDQLLEFLSAKSDATFLFGPEVVTYVDDLLVRATRLMAMASDVAPPSIDHDTALKQLGPESQTLVAVFRPYLGLGSHRAGV